MKPLENFDPEVKDYICWDVYCYALDQEICTRIKAATSEEAVRKYANKHFSRFVGSNSAQGTVIVSAYRQIGNKTFCYNCNVSVSKIPTHHITLSNR